MQIKLDSSVEKFISDLDKQIVAKVLRTIDLLEKFGPSLRLPHSKPVTKGLFELRTRGQQEVRILYVFNKGGIVLVHGFIKKSIKIPQAELNKGLAKLKNLT